MTAGGALAILLAALLAAVVAGSLLRRLAWRIGALDHPDGRLKRHAAPVPVLGGGALVAGLVAGLGAAGPDARAALLLLAPAAGFLLLGALDDRRALGPGVKLAAGLVLALAWLVLGRPFGPTSWSVTLAAAVVLLALANAANLVDVADALCASAVLVSSLALGALLARLGDAGSAALALALAGAAAGFLWHNRPPARLYLGDGGSLLAGFLLGHLVLRACDGLAGRPLAVRLAPLLLVGLLLVEAAFVSALRLARGRSPLLGGPDHLVHQLRRLGAGEAQSVAILAAVAATLAGVGLAITGAAP